MGCLLYLKINVWKTKYVREVGIKKATQTVCWWSPPHRESGKRKTVNTTTR